MNDSLLVYKLTIMYLLDHSGQKLTRAMISDFMAGEAGVPYFSLMSSLSELKEAGFTKEEKALNRTLITLTDKGRESLSFFSGMLTADVKNDVDRYLSGNLSSLKRELASVASIEKVPAGFRAKLKTEERGQEIIGVTLTVPDEETAEHICAGWEEASADIYEYITDVLMRDSHTLPNGN